MDISTKKDRDGHYQLEKHELAFVATEVEIEGILGIFALLLSVKYGI